MIGLKSQYPTTLWRTEKAPDPPSISCKWQKLYSECTAHVHCAKNASIYTMNYFGDLETSLASKHTPLFFSVCRDSFFCMFSACSACSACFASFLLVLHVFCMFFLLRVQGVIGYLFCPKYHSSYRYRASRGGNSNHVGEQPYVEKWTSFGGLPGST